MHAHFEQFGIHFQYPDNWSLDADDILAGQGAIAVTSPTGAFWSVSVHNSSAEPGDLIQAVVEAMRKEYQELDAEQVEETIDGLPALGSDLNFYCLDLTNTAEIRVFQAQKRTYLLMWQAEDRDFDDLSAVFRAMTVSFLRESQLAVST